MDQQTQVWVKFTSFVDVVVNDVPFVNGSLYIFCAVLLCLYCGSYVFSRKYVENTLNHNNHIPGSSFSRNTPTSANRYFLHFCLKF